MKVKKVMSRNVVKVSPAASVQQAAKLMRRQQVGMLPVVEENRVLGVITDRDIVINAVARGWVPALTQVSDIMTRDVVWCFNDTAIEDAAHLMAKKQVHRLLVFDRDMTLKGVVSLDDLALRDEKEMSRTVRDVAGSAAAYRVAA